MMDSLKLACAAAVALPLALGGCTRPTTISQQVTPQGFVSLIPAQEGFVVGTSIVRVKNSNGEIFDRICDPRITKSMTYADIKPSPTELTNRVETESRGGNVVVGANNVKGINAKLSVVGSEVRTIKVNVSNAMIYGTDIVHLDLIGKEMDQSSGGACASKMKDYKNRNMEVERILNSFVADATYSVELSGGGGVNLSVDAISVIEGELQAKYDSSSQTFVSGSRLTYAVSFEP